MGIQGAWWGRTEGLQGPFTSKLERPLRHGPGGQGEASLEPQQEQGPLALCCTSTHLHSTAGLRKHVC